MGGQPLFPNPQPFLAAGGWTPAFPHPPRGGGFVKKGPGPELLLEFREAFAHFDKDNDGILTTADLARGRRSPGRSVGPSPGQLVDQQLGGSVGESIHGDVGPSVGQSVSRWVFWSGCEVGGGGSGSLGVSVCRSVGFI